MNSTLPGVRLVLGTQRRGEVVELLEQAIAQDCALVAVETLRKAPFEHLMVHAHEGHTRATMKIQEGCDRWCAYCIIPFCARADPAPARLMKSRQRRRALRKRDSKRWC